MKISVITPASRGVDHLSHLIRDFKNQTFKNFEHLIIYDGIPPDSVRDFMKIHEKDYNIRFIAIEKDSGNMTIAPGTRPRNHGATIAEGEYVCFCDDDDRCKSTYLEAFATELHGDMINVVQMSCQLSRTYKDGDPTRIHLIPEIGLPIFPMCGHISTTCFIVPRKWALADPWRNEPEHDYRFIKRICEKYNPMVRIIPGMVIDTDGLVLKNMTDWVSMPPFYRGD
jgi:glycosyltransferase involved in cell wall biosynthesis